MGRIGFLGVGTMGAGMVRNLIAAGHQVAGWNRSVAKLSALADELGPSLTIAASPGAAAAGAEIVILCVSSDEAVEALMFGDEGVLASLAAGALVIDCGTTGRALTARVAEACRALGLGFIDAPITGSKLGAEGGRLTFMVGGPAELVARAAPLFEVMGRHHVHVGAQVGQGQAAKYCLNMTQAVVLQGVLEGYTLARVLGVPLAKMAEILEHSAGKTGVGSFKTPYLQARDFRPHFRADLMHKDLHLALAEAEARRVPLPAATAVRGLYDQAVAEGLGPEDFLVLAKLLERWARTELRDPDPDSDPDPDPQ
jgi:3-hydroxyisobutyrate dehydrogenase-like beta-hydroxyacid dehydrogenase